MSAEKTALNIHSGHRQKLKDRFVNEGGFQNFQPHEVLEMALFYVIPRSDTNKTAHLLLQRFGSIEGVLNAPIEQLQDVIGVKREAAMYLRMLGSLGHYSSSFKAKRESLNTPQKLINFFESQYDGCKAEKSLLLCLDKKCNVLDCKTILDGSLNFSNFNLRKVADAALITNASIAVMSHYHVNGSPIPSTMDIDTTVTIGNMLSKLEVKLVDHIIVSPNGSVAMSQLKGFSSIFRF